MDFWHYVYCWVILVPHLKDRDGGHLELRERIFNFSIRQEALVLAWHGPNEGENMSYWIKRFRNIVLNYLWYENQY